MTRTGWILAGLVVIVAAAAGWTLRGVLPESAPETEHAHTSDAAYYTCPMHPSVKASEPGACPICGMDLTPVPKGQASGDPGGQGAPETNLPGFITLSTYQQQLIGVKTQVVERRPTSTEVRTVGRVTYDETRLSDVNLKVSGWIRDLYVDYVGKAVRKGDPLFTLYSPELVSSQEEYLLAYRGLRKLEQGSRAAPHAEAVGWNERLLDSARERLLLWDLTEAQIRALETSGKRQTAVTVYAPADGIVTDRMAVSGMFVKPEMRLYRIARLDSVWIKADVYEQELPFVREGQQATVTLSYLPGRTFKGEVDYVYPYLDPKSRTATVRIRLANQDLSLRPGMYADVRLHGDPDTQLTVPEAAVLFSGRRRIVFLALGDGRFQPQEVHLGRRYGSGYEVLEGLQEGDRVVTSANFLLDSESKLKNVMAGMHNH